MKVVLAGAASVHPGKQNTARDVTVAITPHGHPHQGSKSESEGPPRTTPIPSEGWTGPLGNRSVAVNRTVAVAKEGSGHPHRGSQSAETGQPDVITGPQENRTVAVNQSVTVAKKGSGHHHHSEGWTAPRGNKTVGGNRTAAGKASGHPLQGSKRTKRGLPESASTPLEWSAPLWSRTVGVIRTMTGRSWGGLNQGLEERKRGLPGPIPGPSEALAAPRENHTATGSGPTTTTGIGSGRPPGVSEGPIRETPAPTPGAWEGWRNAPSAGTPRSATLTAGPDLAPELNRGASSQASSSAAPETTTEVTAVAISQATPVAAREASLDSIPDATPEVTPEATLESIPEVTATPSTPTATPSVAAAHISGMPRHRPRCI
jgi:hypothetical protein